MGASESDSRPTRTGCPSTRRSGSANASAGGEVAHSYGIAHLDLKPANVLFRATPEGVWDVPKVADWGLARVLAENTGTMDGLSPEYAAPEQLDPGEFGDTDTLTDVYQVGALCYALLTGEPPATGGQLAVMRETLSNETPTPPSERRPGLPPAVDAAVLTALELSKSDRYRAISVFASALNAVRTGGPLPPIVSARVDEPAPTQRSLEDRNDDETAHEADRQGRTETEEPAVQSESIPSESGTDGDWTTFGGGVSRSGAPRSRATGPSAPVEEVWRFEADDRVRSSPAVVHGAVYVGSDDGNVYSLDSATGDLKWRRATGEPVRSSPAVVDGTLYVGSDDACVYALEAAGGDVLWSRELKKHVRAAPTVHDGTVYVAAGDLYALDATSGEQEWRMTDSLYRSAPTVGDDEVYVGARDSTVSALDAATGELHWRFKADRPVWSSPALVSGVVYVGCWDDIIYAIDVETGERVWQHETDRSIPSSLAVRDDALYVANQAGTVYALDRAAQTVSWRQDVGGPVMGTPVAGLETVYVGSSDGRVSALDAASGDVRWQNSTAGHVEGSPSVADSVVYVGDDEGTVYALGNGE